MKMPLPLEQVSDEVFIASDDIVRLDSRAVAFVRECAAKNPRGRARICAHKKPTDSLHEMLIAITNSSYIRPHRHTAKSESFHLVDGAADIVIFHDDGDIKDVVELGPGRNFYYRLDVPSFHTLIINSPMLVIHEVTNGPFDRTQSDVASFSPAEGDPAVVDYMERLMVRLREWKDVHGLH